MEELFKNSDLVSYVLMIFKYLIRILTITLNTLGLVYVTKKIFTIKMTKKKSNLLALFFINVNSFLITYFYFHGDYKDFRFYWESITFALISVVVYILFAEDLYSRIDSFLDKRLGKNKRNVR